MQAWGAYCRLIESFESADITVSTAANTLLTQEQLPDTAQRFLSQLAQVRRLSPLTATRYAQALRRLHAVQMDLSQVRATDLIAVLKQQRAAGITPRSLAVMASAWRSYARWAIKQGVLTLDPTLQLSTPKAAKPLPKALGIDQAGGLIDRSHNIAAEPGTPEHAFGLRDAAILELLYGAGLRAAELLSIDREPQAQSISWVDWAASEVRVLGKGGKTRRVPLPSMTIDAIKAWVAVRPLVCSQPDEPALFVGKRGGRLSGTELRRATQRAGQNAGLNQGLHPHMLRHSFASHVLQSSGDLRAVQELLGHSSIVATQVYTRLDFQHLSKVYDQAHPRAKLAKVKP